MSSLPSLFLDPSIAYSFWSACLLPSMPSQRTYGTQASQGPSRRRQEPEPESSEEDEAEVEEGQADAEGLTQATGNGGLSEAVSIPQSLFPLAAGIELMPLLEIKKLAGQLCRFALFKEYSKQFVTRQDVVKTGQYWAGLCRDQCGLMFMLSPSSKR